MGNLCACNGNQDSDNSDKTALLTAKRNNDSEISAALLIQKLISAVEDENEDVAKSLLDEFSNTSYVFAKSWSSDSLAENQETKFEIWRDAMYLAIEKETKHSEEIMKLLLNCDIILSLETKLDDHLLHRLIRVQKEVDDKNLRLIEMLLKSGIINVNARDLSGATVLHRAGEVKLTSLLIRYSADVNKRDREGNTPLMSMWGKQVSVVPTILKEARTLVDLDVVDYRGRTALMIATIENQPDVVDLLLNVGASVNLSDHLGFTALHHALFARLDHYDHFPRNSEELKKRKEIFTILFDAKDERCDWYMRNKEWIAKKIKIVEMLLGKQDIDVNALSFEKFSPLDIVEGCIPRTPSFIENALKNKGAVLNVFRPTEMQSTSNFHLDVRCKLAFQRLLHNVCTNLEQDLTQDLLEKRLLTLIETFHDQILAGKDQHGRTALHLVANFVQTIWLVNNPRFLRRNLGNTIVKELITIGCNVNENDVFGRTPLHYAATTPSIKDSLISHGADASIKDKDGNSAVDEIPQQFSTYPYDILKAVIHQNDETYFLLQMNNKQMKIEVRCVDSQVRATYDNREIYLKTVPRLLWAQGEYAFRHPLVEKITKEVTDLMSVIAKEIERLDPRFESKPEFFGSSNEGTRLRKPDEFNFCFVLTKISEICEVSLSPELPTGFVRLKRKPAKVEETSDFDSFFMDDGMLNTDKVHWQFKTILLNALVNIESQQCLDWNLQLPIRELSDSVKKPSSIQMIKRLNFSPAEYISIDIVPCIHVDGWWADEAISNVSDDIKKFGCNFIFDRPNKLYPWVPYLESCAMISFAKAESDMIRHSCDNAREAYMIGQAMLEIWHPDSTYTLKNCLLYCIEALTPTSEIASQLGLSLEELESKFHQMDRYLWLKCLMKCYLEFVAQDFCPCYFLPNYSSPIENTDLKRCATYWMTDRYSSLPELCRMSYALYRCTSNDTSESCCQLPAPDPLWERLDRNKLIARLFKIAYV